MIATFRASLILIIFLLFTLPLMPIQGLFNAGRLPFARTFPHWYHRQVCRILGIRLNISGHVRREGAVFLISNHVSWLDIPVLSAVAPLSFIAKKEVAGWPFVSWLAKLQRTIFVDRNNRTAVPKTTTEISQRLENGDSMLLFAEGTSSDGNRVLPFKSSLFAAITSNTGSNGQMPQDSVFVQTIALAYTSQHGVPLGRIGRPFVAWYGDMEMMSHVWNVVKRGPLDVHIHIGDPVPLETYPNRKELAKGTEKQIRAHVTALLRGNKRHQSEI